MMRRGYGVVLAVVLLIVLFLPASAQVRRADFVTLIGDTDDAIRLAKVIKDILGTEPTARRAMLAARDAVIQSWLEDKSSADLSDQERAVIRNPEYFDRAVVSAVTVAFSVSPVSITLDWDVPPRFWPRLAPTIIPVGNRVAREGALFARKALRLVVRLQVAEVYRANVDTDGTVTVVFQYE